MLGDYVEVLYEDICESEELWTSLQKKLKLDPVEANGFFKCSNTGPVDGERDVLKMLEASRIGRALVGHEEEIERRRGERKAALL